MIHKHILTLPFLALIFSCTSLPDKISAQALGNHLTAKAVTSLSSEQGKIYLKNIEPSGLNSLRRFWVPQRKSYCGVCSAVIVSNTLLNNKGLNQDNFFSPSVVKVIKPATVSRMGMTLRELRETMTRIAPNLTTTKYYSHISGLDLFKEQIKNWNHEDEMIIVNFSRQSIAGTGMYSGHFSIVAGYDRSSRQVLILEVNGEKESFWISERDLFDAMLAIDPVSKIPRGWVTVKKGSK
jgi:hypothetical protein